MEGKIDFEAIRAIGSFSNPAIYSFVLSYITRVSKHDLRDAIEPQPLNHVYLYNF